MENEGRSEADRRRDAPDSLQSAADDLRRRSGADQPTPAAAGEFIDALKKQAVGLYQWAKSSGRLLNGADILSHSKEGGQEHCVRYDPQDGRYIKITHPDQFGLYPEPVPVLDRVTQKLVHSFRLRKALPVEYLDRLQRSNELFGDDHRLEGVFVQNGQLRTVISQPALKGVPPTAQAIYDAMAEAGFEVVRSGGSQFFYRPEDNTAVFDGHEGNFLETREGILPIDVIPVHPEGDLLKAIREARSAIFPSPPPAPP